jgi:hypothetical protein
MRITIKAITVIVGILTTGCLPTEQAYQTKVDAATKPVLAPIPSLFNVCKSKDVSLFARYKIQVEGSSVASIPFPPAENESSLMLGYKSDVSDSVKKELRHYLQSRLFTASGHRTVLLEKTITKYGETSKERRILILKGYENKYLAVTGPTSGNFTGYNEPVRLFTFSTLQDSFQLLAEIRLKDGMVNGARIDILGQSGILMLQSYNYTSTRLNFFKLNLVSGSVDELKNLETTYPSNRIYPQFLKLNTTGFVLGLHKEIFQSFPSGGGYFINKAHILRSENDSSFLHEEPFLGSSFRDFALAIDHNDNIYSLNNSSSLVRDQAGYAYMESVAIASRYDGTSVSNLDLTFEPFKYKYGGFAVQTLIADKNELYFLARTYDDGNDRTADYLLLNTADDGSTYTQKSITKNNSSDLLYYIARTQGSTFVIGNDQQTSETLIYCAQ